MNKMVDQSTKVIQKMKHAGKPRHIEDDEEPADDWFNDEDDDDDTDMFQWMTEENAENIICKSKVQICIDSTKKYC